MDSKYKNIGLNLAVIVLALIVSANIYKRQVKQMQALKADKEMEIKKNAVFQNIGKLEEKLDAYKNLLARKDTNKIMNDINNLAKESDVKIVSIKPAQEKAEQDYIKLPLELVLSVPDYHVLGKFISKLESYTDVYVIESLEINSESQKNELTANLRLITIIYKDKDEAKADI